MEAAVGQSKVPLVVHCVGKVDHRVERRHGSFSERKVQEKIIGDRPHALVCHNYPDDGDIAYYGHNNYATVGNGPEDDFPDRLHKLVLVRGVVKAGGPIWLIIE